MRMTMASSNGTHWQPAAGCGVPLQQQLLLKQLLKLQKQTTAAATEAAKEAAETAAAAAGTADVADKKVGISIYKFDDNFMTLYRTGSSALPDRGPWIQG